MGIVKYGLGTALLFCLLAGGASAQAAGPDIAVNVRVEGLIKGLTLYLARFVELAAALVIGIASPTRPGELRAEPRPRHGNRSS